MGPVSHAPSRPGAPDAGASASAARSASSRARPEAEHQQQLLQALTTEHFTLQTARSATIDINGQRMTLDPELTDPARTILDQLEQGH